MQNVEYVASFFLSAFSKMWQEKGNLREELQSKNELERDALEYFWLIQITKDPKISLLLDECALDRTQRVWPHNY